MSQNLSLLVTLALAAACHAPGAPRHALGSSGAAASAPPVRASEARVSGVCFEPLVQEARPVFFGPCPEVHASSAGLYSVLELGDGLARFQVRLHAGHSRGWVFEGVDSLRAAAHPSRPELILSGSYSGRTAPVFLRAGAPTPGTFLIALDPDGRPLWERVVATAHPRFGPAPRLLSNGSVVAYGLEEHAPLFGVAEDSAGSSTWFLSRVDANGAVSAFEWYPERQDILGLAAADGAALYELVREPGGKVLLRRRVEANRVTATTELRYGGAGPLAADPRGGVWVFAQVRLEASLPELGLLHYDGALALLEKFAVEEIPRGLVVDTQQQLWSVGRSSLAVRRPHSALAFQWRSAELDGELHPFDGGAVLAQRTREGGCRVDRLTSLSDL